MPGIAGIIGHGPADVHRPLVEAMLASMKHEEFYCAAIHSAPGLGVCVGSTMLEPAPEGQIFLNEREDVALVLSGECFLESAISDELRRKGHQIGETRAGWLVHLYEEKGERFVEDLNGLFSGMLLDGREHKAFLFNDRYGSERIYWHETRDALYFASEAKALLSVLPQLRTFDEQGVSQFLSHGCTLGGTTLFRGIQLLPGAALWSFKNGVCKKKQYFSPATWEAQEGLTAEGFITKFQETFARILPRYFESQSTIGISLTGGLDTRMIMACLPKTPEKPKCYTFSGPEGKTLDDQLAAQVAEVCSLDHQLFRLDSDFFSNFARHVDRTVYLTDGCFGVLGAHEIYFNRKARELAHVRLTGNYGSEVLRGTSTLKRLGLDPRLFSPQFNRASSLDAELNGSRNPITFAAFTEIPSNLFGSLAAGRSQVQFRTPYLDNEIVSLAYRAPESLRCSSLPAWHLIEANNPRLARIPTDRGRLPGRKRPGAALKRFFLEATFKLDYLNNEGWPNWFAPGEPLFRRVTSSLGIVGLHKYLHYRTWFRRELADYIKSAVDDARARQTPFWNTGFLEKMTADHISGRKNYVLEINTVLTLATVERVLFRDLSIPPKNSENMYSSRGLPQYQSCAAGHV